MFHLISLYKSTSELQKTVKLSNKDAPDTDQLLEICLATRLFWLKPHHMEKSISDAAKLKRKTGVHEEKG